MELIYFIIALSATCIGSMTGAGGGIIIKPVVDLLNQYNSSTISLLTSFTLIAMSFVNIAGHILRKKKIKYCFAFLMIIGAISGGVSGGKLLAILVYKLNDDALVKAIQNSILIIITLLSFLYVKNIKNISSLNINTPIFTILISFILGGVSAFLGIGGGPINVAVIMFFFGIDVKDTAMYSLLLILFAQVSKILSFSLYNNFSDYDLSVLPFMIIGGVLGGFIGAKLNKISSDKTILILFNTLQLFVISTCIFTIIRYFI